MNIKKRYIVNKKSVDIHIRDIYGTEHTIFPQQRKKIDILEKETKKDDK